MWTEIPKPTRLGKWLRIYYLPEEWVRDVRAIVEDGFIELTTDTDILEWQIVYRDQETLMYVCTEPTLLGRLYRHILLIKRFIKGG